MVLLSAGTSGVGSFMQLVGVLLIFVFVLALTYLTTRWIANYQKVQGEHKNLRVLETIRIANNKYVQLVEAGEEYLVIAVGKDEAHLLTVLTREQFKVGPQETNDFAGKNAGETFGDVLQKLREHLPKNRQKND